MMPTTSEVVFVTSEKTRSLMVVDVCGATQRWTKKPSSSFSFQAAALSHSTPENRLSRLKMLFTTSKPFLG